jgi:LuxR family maltose regulon positive regulatory protein
MVGDAMDDGSGLDPAGRRLMLSKLDPPEAGGAVVVRARLLDRLASAARGQVTLVTAPAGAGKTTLLRSWLAARRVPGLPAWVSLDPADRDPDSFWSYVVAALDRVGLGLPGGPAAGADGSPAHQLAAALYGRAEPIVLVLDDADALAGSPVPGQLDFLARHAGRALRLVLASRGDAQVNRLRHRLEGSVTDIGAEDLAVTEAEAREVFAVHGLAPSDECLRAVLRRTAGWMAGVTLTALTARERFGAAGRGPGVDDRAVLTGADDDIADYLDAEVVALLPASDRQLLLQVGLVEHLSGALAAELSGRPAVRPALDDLGRRTGWVRRCQRHEDCHRVHPLLVRLLGTRRSAASSRRLHRRAGQWYAAGGRAAVHLATAQDWPEAASALVNGYALGRLLGGPQAGGLLAAFAGMPPDSPGAQSAVVLAAAAVAGRDAEAAAKQLGRAEELVDDVPPDRAGALALALAVAGAGLARLSRDVDRALDARAALDRALAEIEAGGGSAGAESRAIVLADVGAVLLHAGRLDAAAAVLAEGLAAGTVDPGRHPAGVGAGDPAADRAADPAAHAGDPAAATADPAADPTAAAAVPPALAAHLGDVAAGARALAAHAGDGAAAPSALAAHAGDAAAAPSALAAARSVLTARLSLVEALRGHLAVARRLATAGAGPAGPEPAGDGGRPARGPAEARAALALVAVESGSAAEVEPPADPAPDDPVVAAVLGLVRARSLRAAGRLDEALSVLAATRHPVGRDAPPSWLDGTLVAAVAAVWTASGRPERALQALAEGGHGGPDVCLETARAHLASGEVDRCAEQVAAVLRRGDLALGVRVEAWLLRAQAALARGDRTAAQHAADRALRTATEERLLRPVSEASPRLRGLLRAAGPDLVGPRRGTGPARGRRPGVGGRGASPPLPAPTPGRPVVVEPLTAREQEVLGYLSALLSTEEIAELMFVSVNTVKSHVRGILRKLGAPRRNEAVRRARELQLV